MSAGRIHNADIQYGPAHRVEALKLFREDSKPTSYFEQLHHCCKVQNRDGLYVQLEATTPAESFPLADLASAALKLGLSVFYRQFVPNTRQLLPFQFILLQS